ncbi:MAG: hypothetical protein ACE37B_07150 [Ilumatobacter sp.]|uniref:hypothetical protein n=1 Tax=Ilumatobacter sp. TaxID=1967498 RepID=UPI00391BD5F3
MSHSTALSPSPMTVDRRRGRRRRRLAFGVWTTLPVLTGAVLVAPSGTADASPLDDVSPSSDGLPGAVLFTQILSWGFWLALGVCGLVILYGAATWRGMNGNSGRGVEGKMYVAAGAIGAMVIGLAPTIVSVLFDAGQAG